MAKSTAKKAAVKAATDKSKKAPARGAPPAQKVTLESLGKTRSSKMKEPSIAEKAVALAAQQAAEKKAAEAAAAIAAAQGTTGEGTPGGANGGDTEVAPQDRPAPLPDGQDDELLNYDETTDAGATGKSEDTENGLADAVNNTNAHINEMNNNFQGANGNAADASDEEEEGEKMDTDFSPSNSPVKKKSKRDALASLVKPKKPAAQPVTELKRKTTVSLDATAVFDHIPTSKEKEAMKTGDGGTPKSQGEEGDSSKQPASALRKPKYSSVVKTPAPKANKPEPKPHYHKHKRIVVEGSIDLGKSSFAHLDSNGKKVHHAITILSRNLEMGDEFCVINHEDPTSKLFIGTGGHKVPDNMTRLRSYILNMNINQFKEGGGRQQGDALDSLGGKGKKQGGGKVLYFVCHISCDRDPRKLVENVAFEWMSYGNMLRVKELQSVETETPIIFYNLSTEVQKATVVEEVNQCLKLAQERMSNAIDFAGYDWEVAMGDLPEVTIRSNIPRPPKSKSVKETGKLPNYLQNSKRTWHLECSRANTSKVLGLVKYGKKIGIFKEILGPHVHPTEMATYESSANDIKRAHRFFKDHINYNASMTCTDINGIQDISATVHIYEGRRIVQSVSGKFCLISLFKLRDGSSVIGEVHQASPGEIVTIVHPNIPEAEQLMQNFAKHPAGFLKHFLASLGVDAQFVKSLMTEILDPSLIHDAEYCTWDEENRAITTQEELDEDEEAAKLSSQSWFKDIVTQYESIQQKETSRKSKNYASAAALYDLDATRSIKTTHEENDGEERAEELDEVATAGEKSLGGEAEVVVLDGEEQGDEDGEVEIVEGESERLRKESSGPKGASDFQSGSTPISVEDRSTDGNNDQEEGGSITSDGAESVTKNVQTTSAASAAENHEPSMTGASG